MDPDTGKVVGQASRHVARTQNTENAAPLVSLGAGSSPRWTRPTPGVMGHCYLPLCRQPREGNLEGSFRRRKVGRQLR